MKRLRLRPRSVPGLLLAGFAFVALPLVVAIGFAVVYLDRLSEQSERLVVQGVEVTRLSRRINSAITAMERNARQYAVLGDPALAESFAEHYQSFNNALTEITHLNLDSVPAWDLEALREQAAAVAAAVATRPLDTGALTAQIERFSRMRELADVIAVQGNSFIDSELARIQATSREARFFLLLCVFALIPASALLVGLFTVVISRPIRQIRQEIQRLGEGDFGNPVAISAPSAELDALGEQLDWMRRRLEALESEKNQFLQHMSHELKTPLASIREGAELLRDGTLGGLTPEQGEVAGILQKNSLELMALIENLLDFTAWRQQQARVAADYVNLRDIAANVVNRHQLAIDARSVQVTLPDPAVQVYADRDRLRLILDNLIANAVKFSPEAGRVRIRGRRGRSHATIEVSDDGPGIPESEREHIFTPFYQAQPAAHTHVRGTGLGLSVVREGVRAHGGSIKVIDQDRRGACFRIRLPNGATH